jgi:hypothetical protein
MISNQYANGTLNVMIILSFSNLLRHHPRKVEENSLPQVSVIDNLVG